MKRLNDYIKEGQYEGEIPLTPVTYCNDHTSMLNEPVLGKDIDKLVKYVNNVGEVNYKLDDSYDNVLQNSGLDKDEFDKEKWVAIVDPESYENEVIIVPLDDCIFPNKEDEKIYKK